MIGKLANVIRLATIFAVGGKLGCNARDRRVHILQRLEHVHFPVEEQIDFRRAAAGDGAHRLQAGHAVDRLLNRTRDGDHHLVDGHHAVIHADQDARESSVEGKTAIGIVNAR